MKYTHLALGLLFVICVIGCEDQTQSATKDIGPSIMVDGDLRPEASVLTDGGLPVIDAEFRTGDQSVVSLSRMRVRSPMCEEALGQPAQPQSICKLGVEQMEAN